MTCGVYWVRRKGTNDMYVGSSSNIERRWKAHVEGKGNLHLFNAIQKYGIKKFEFKVILECEDGVMKNREQYYLDKYEPKYNMSKSATGFEVGTQHLVGRKWTQTRIDRMVVVLKTYYSNPENRKKRSEANKGNLKLIDSMKGNNNGTGGKGKGNLEKKASREAKRNMSVAVTAWWDQRKSLGVYVTPETKRKMSIAAKARWAIRKSEQLEKEN